MQRAIINQMIPSSDALAHDPKAPPVSCGTTLVAVEFKDGVVIGADSRTSAGSYVVNRVTDKLTQVSDTIYCCRSGSSADTQAITDVVKYHLSVFEQTHGQKATVEVAAQVFRGLCYDYRDDFTAGILVAGWDEVKGGQVYSIPIGGMITRRAVSSGGSGSTYIHGYIDSNFKEGMAQEECEKFVKHAVALAIDRDGSSGGVCRLGTITKKGMERKWFTRSKLPAFNEI